MLRKFLTSAFLFFALSCITANAQKKVPAYIITSAADTVTGRLLLESISKRSNKIKFDKGEGYTDYEASSILAYGIGDSLYYESKDVFIAAQTHKAFLQVLVKGSTKLYYSPNLSTKGEYYFQKLNEPVVHLNKDYYRSVLISMLGDCEQLDLKLGSALERLNSYNGNSLANVINAYNSCSNPAEESVILYITPKPKVRFGVKTGVHYNRSGFDSSVHSYKEYSISGGTGITAGFFSSLNFKNNLSFQVEALYTSRRFEANFTYENSTDINYKEHAIVEAKYVQLPLLIGYTFNSNKLKPYINGGASYNLLVQKNMHHQVTYETGYSYSNPLNIDGKMVGLLINAGLKRQLNNVDLLLEARYNYEETNSSLVVQKLNFSTFSIFTGINF